MLHFAFDGQLTLFRLEIYRFNCLDCGLLNPLDIGEPLRSGTKKHHRSEKRQIDLPPWLHLPEDDGLLCFPITRVPMTQHIRMQQDALLSKN